MDSKLIISWLVGRRDAGCAYVLVEDLAGRLRNRVQLTTDGHRSYLEAVENAFGSEIDYATLVKLYGSEPEGEKRYSPAVCIGCRSTKIAGEPDPRHVSTAYTER